MQATTTTSTATSPQTSTPTKVNLPSLFPALPGTVVRFEVKPGGLIDVPPGRFLAGQEEVVSWVITNISNEQITVALTKFMKKAHFSHAHGQHPAGGYFQWLGHNQITLNSGEIGRIYARVKRGPDYPPMVDCLSYTIEVRSATVAIDYDPDGDIKP